MILMRMLIDGYLWEDFHFTPYSSISYVLDKSRTMNDELLPLTELLTDILSPVHLLNSFCH
jgi:hypothetical protein